MKAQTSNYKLQGILKSQIPIIARCAGLLAVLTFCAALSGCVSKAKAKEQAREAFFAGQQQAMTRLMQSRSGPSISVIGPVRSPSIAFTEGLTVSKAIIEAGYEPPGAPKQIVILRNGYAIPVEPRQLLAGQDVPLQDRDILQITP